MLRPGPFAAELRLYAGHFLIHLLERTLLFSTALFLFCQPPPPFCQFLVEGFDQRFQRFDTGGQLTDFLFPGQHAGTRIPLFQLQPAIAQAQTFRCHDQFAGSEGLAHGHGFIQTLCGAHPAEKQA